MSRGIGHLIDVAALATVQGAARARAALAAGQQPTKADTRALARVDRARRRRGRDIPTSPPRPDVSGVFMQGPPS